MKRKKQTPGFVGIGLLLALLQLALLQLALLPVTTRHLYAQAEPQRLQNTEPATVNQADSTTALSEEAQQFLASVPQAWIENADAYLVPGEILVGVRTSQQPDSLHRSLATRSGQAVQLVDSFQLNGSDPASDLVIQRWQVPTGKEWQVIANLQNDPNLLFAEPNWLVVAVPPDGEAAVNTQAETQRVPEILVTPEEEMVQDAARSEESEITAGPEDIFVTNDPLYLENQWYLQRINASHAWSLVYESGYINQLAPIRVAIIDSGIDTTHPEFAGRLLSGKNYVTANQPVSDDYGHGTHVAGLIAAGLNNGAGIGSMAPFVQIDPLKVLNEFGSGNVYNVAQAVRDAADSGADIVNMSLEVAASAMQSNPALNQVFQSAVQYAYQRNVLQIAAAGNYYPQPVSYPAAYTQVVAIGALTFGDERAYYSSIGNEVELSAPGGEGTSHNNGVPIYSTWSKIASAKCKDGSYRVIGNGAYCNSEGTSMASPIAASVAALVWAIRPELTAQEVRTILKETAKPIGLPTQEMGAGRVDAYAAVRRVLRSRITLSQSLIQRELPLAASPFNVYVRIENPSTEPLPWNVKLPFGVSWIKFADSAGNVLTDTQVSGVVRYGEPAFLTLAISPTSLITGSYYGVLSFTGTRPDASQAKSTFVVNVAIANQVKTVFVPYIARDGTGTTPPPTTSTPFRWLSSISYTTYALADSNHLGLSFPPSFTFSLRGRTYADFRIFSDGFMTFPATESGIVTPNRCLPDQNTPEQAIYGWWSNLDPSAANSRVSTFMADKDTFVVEFNNVPMVSLPNQPRISFQMVLSRNGDIGLNYQNIPKFIGKPPAVTIGVEARNELFSNQLACNTATYTYGILPESNQSFLLKASDLQ